MESVQQDRGVPGCAFDRVERVLPGYDIPAPVDVHRDGPRRFSFGRVSEWLVDANDDVARPTALFGQLER
jgi:hypothetical protein